MPHKTEPRKKQVLVVVAAGLLLDQTIVDAFEKLAAVVLVGISDLLAIIPVVQTANVDGIIFADPLADVIEVAVRLDEMQIPFVFASLALNRDKHFPGFVLSAESRHVRQINVALFPSRVPTLH